MEVIKTADWVIDMGPEGGDGGGRIVAQGTPEDIAADNQSHTGRFLRKVLARRPLKRPAGEGTAKPAAKKGRGKVVGAGVRQAAEQLYASIARAGFLQKSMAAPAKNLIKYRMAAHL